MSDNQHRLFPLHDYVQVFNESQFNDLIGSIKDGLLNKPDKNSVTNSIEAGQTYIGQMIAHDIVSSTNLDHSRMDVSPLLNLDSLYGDDNNPAYFDQYGFFILGHSIDDKTKKMIYGQDLLRDSCGKALIPDSRNNENLIISQLHLFWQKFHNKVLKEIKSFDLFKDPFIYAKNIVIDIFHEIVMHDFLYQVLKLEIYELYFKNCSQFTFKYGTNNQKFNAVPLEFSKAAFRFGHSMVRNEYTLKGSNTIAAKDMLINRNKLLDSNNVIDWGNFFNVSGINFSIFHNRHIDASEKNDTNQIIIEQPPVTKTAFKIDTILIQAMRKLPFEVTLNAKEKSNDIRQINLHANIFDQRICNGESIRIELNKIPEFKKYLNKSYYSEKPLINLPLWPYILLEAEYNFKQNKRDGLGPIGSIIIAEVIKSSINNVKKIDSKKYRLILNHIKSSIKESYIKSEIKLKRQDEEQIRNYVSIYSLKMGMCIKYNQ